MDPPAKMFTVFVGGGAKAFFVSISFSLYCLKSVASIVLGMSHLMSNSYKVLPFNTVSLIT